MKYMVATIFVCLLTGCATHFQASQYALNNPKWSDDIDGWKIASDYYHINNKKDGKVYTLGMSRYVYFDTVDQSVFTVLENALVRKGLNPDHLPLIRKGDICVGMNILGMYAAWGLPRDTIETTSEFGTLIQYQYGFSYVAGNKIYNNLKYVHTQNGIITSITKL